MAPRGGGWGLVTWCVCDHIVVFFSLDWKKILGWLKLQIYISIVWPLWRRRGHVDTGSRPCIAVAGFHGRYVLSMDDLI